jgi:hypothetical protein
VDAWMRHDKFGFAVEINVPASIADFSISMDFKGSNSFNMQTWNLEYWNFYKGNTLVVLHSKRSTMDLEDRFSKLIVVEGMSIRKYRKLTHFLISLFGREILKRIMTSDIIL